MSFADIVINGKYYKPANSRYAPNSSVICDRCKKSDLIACIGYMDQDLCLPCADQVSVIMERNKIKPITQMDSSRFGSTLSRMGSDRFDRNITYMLSDRFNNQNTMTLMASNRFRDPIDYNQITGLTDGLTDGLTNEISNISIDPFAFDSTKIPVDQNCINVRSTGASRSNLPRGIVTKMASNRFN